MARPTNTQLATQLRELKNKLVDVSTTTNIRLTKIETKLEPIGEFMAIVKDRQSRGSNGVSLPKEVLRILMYLAGALVLALGGKELLQ